ncbi:dihydrofolate reductase [Rhodalgimonas zhirmunskyi]|uniref:dihydrofolate reductase n=1 Tax=Rhodalgimonas zhirmunskyi TaxID=2964767 RepID=A0AAJ1U954_9RHOB|nr:dihydrofolate reductase [Rhodoalgimonas zhirmunskyi]MDQ2094080.1 dihydrofolate reductase [Rhodoalgimonas zhirmunskyi]
MISLVVARARNGAIGRDNTIPWHLPADLKMFQRETLGSALLMGRNTWESLPVKPLKNRMNIVIATKTCDAEHVFPNLDRAIAFATAQGYTRLTGIGGARIYADLLPRAHRLVITEVALDVPDADTFFPEVEELHWAKTQEFGLEDPEIDARVVEYLRRP